MFKKGELVALIQTPRYKESSRGIILKKMTTNTHIYWLVYWAGVDMDRWYHTEDLRTCRDNNK